MTNQYQSYTQTNHIFNQLYEFSTAKYEGISKVQAPRLTPGPVVPERLVPNASNHDGKVTAAGGIVK